MTENLYELKNKNIHILGLAGTEGSSLALFLISLGCKNIFGHDFSQQSDFVKNYYYYHQNLSSATISKQIKQLKNNLKAFYFKDSYLKNITKADFILAPSSWFRYKINAPLKKNYKIWNWYNLLLKYFPGTVIGVTGTAGKGTTVNLIYQILKTAGKKALMIGDSWQMMDLKNIFSSNKKTLVVAEVSNRTLTFAKNLKKSPKISVVTNITKNHLDDHQGSFNKYIATKKEIAKYQTSHDFLVINKNDLISKKLKSFSPAKKIYFYSADKNKKLIKNPDLIGEHLISDAVAAIKVVKILKISTADIIKGIKKFKSRQGRLQFIKKIQGISFYNDAASTRPEATIAAIKSFTKNKLNLILEGSRYKPEKKQFLQLIKTIDKFKVRKVAVSGKISNFLYPLLLKSQAEIFKTKNLKESLKILIKKAKKDEIILLSPACESFGEFKDYRERINSFNEFVKKLNET
ncbi:UDP-N-acetylmuramoyl-L-alanine--D-glutamate ligase [Patescibacteria group bacterium]|nr:UDP-N-acetylmuramoyl-L-alanine--D-glutamate ligase [Patescibacteria group bacterium]